MEFTHRCDSFIHSFIDSLTKCSYHADLWFDNVKSDNQELLPEMLQGSLVIGWSLCE